MISAVAIGKSFWHILTIAYDMIVMIDDDAADAADRRDAGTKRLRSVSASWTATGTEF